MTTPPSTPTSTSARPGPSDPPPQVPGGPSRRRAIGIGIGALAGVGLAAWGGSQLLGDDSSRTTPSPAPSTPFTRQDWMSGVSGEGVADGAVAAARGSDLDISATWFDNNEAQLELWTLQPGAEFESWTKPLDISLGAIEEGSGETWAQAAGGAYDDRWRQSLTNLRDVWADRNTAYIRFAHEMNGDWYDWEVRSDEVDDFKTSWERYRSLQQEVFPASKLVFCVNRESTQLGRDWRELYPGDGQVDVMSVDYYNQFPGISTDEEWDASMAANDRFGAPKGLQGHLDFAREVGLPLAVSEWSGNAEEGGDAPVFVNRMNDFFARNGGTGAGQVLYEVQFNVVMPDDERKFLLVSPLTEMPESAAAYAQLDW